MDGSLIIHRQAITRFEFGIQIPGSVSGELVFRRNFLAACQMKQARLKQRARELSLQAHALRLGAVILHRDTGLPAVRFRLVAPNA